MQKKLKRIICIAMTLLMIVTAFPVTAFAADSCGNGTNWDYKKDSHTIFISGSGKSDAVMSNYESNKDTPWYSKNIFVKAPGDKVALNHKAYKIARTVSVNGTTAVGSYAFSSLDEVTSASCSASVKKIGHHAFANDKKLASVSLPAITIIRESAFEGCTALKTVSLPSIERIDARAFASSGLTSITIPESVKFIDSTAFSGCKNLTVSCVKGTYADSFCSKYGIKVKYLNTVNLSADFDTNTKNLVLTLSLSGSKGLDSGIFEITYDSKKLSFANSVSSATSELNKDNIVVNSSASGKLTISVMLAENAKSDSFSLIKIPFKVSSSIAQQDSASFSVSAKNISVSGNERAYNSSELKNANLHKYTDTVYAPTCKTEGYTLHKCSICGREYKDNIVVDLNAHKYEVIKYVEATCDTDGIKVEKCTVCGTENSTVLTATGHSYVETVVAPTCTEQGYTLHKCSVCGDEYKDSYTDKSAHTYEKQTTAATCVTDGKNVYVCTVCGHSYSETIKATGHKWDSGVIARPATKTRKGIMKYTCNVCREVRNEDIPPLSDDTDKPVNPPKPTDPSTPTTNPDDTKTTIEIKDGETGITVDTQSKYIKVNPLTVKGLTYAEFKDMFKTAPEISYPDTDNVRTSDTVKANGEDYTVILLGDVDANGKINATDARIMLRVAAKLESATDAIIMAGDLDSNGKITAAEARTALRYAARLEQNLA